MANFAGVSVFWGSSYRRYTMFIKFWIFLGKSATPSESFEFLRHEVPVRLAHIMKEINLLPRNLRRMPSVELVKSWYIIDCFISSFLTVNLKTM